MVELIYLGNGGGENTGKTGEWASRKETVILSELNNMTH